MLETIDPWYLRWGSDSFRWLGIPLIVGICRGIESEIVGFLGARSADLASPSVASSLGQAARATARARRWR